MRKPKAIRQRVKDTVKAVVLANRNTPKGKPILNAYGNGKSYSLGYRMSPAPTISHRISMHPGKGAGSKADKMVSLVSAIAHSDMPKAHRFISLADSSLTKKQLKAKYRVRDSELYDMKKQFG